MHQAQYRFRASIDSKKVIREMLNNRGKYEDDAPVGTIYRYERGDANGRETYAYYSPHEPKPDPIVRAPGVKNVILLFSDGSPTEAGKCWLQQNWKL